MKTLKELNESINLLNRVAGVSNDTKAMCYYRPRFDSGYSAGEVTVVYVGDQLIDTVDTSEKKYGRGFKYSTGSAEIHFSKKRFNEYLAACQKLQEAEIRIEIVRESIELKTAAMEKLTGESLENLKILLKKLKQSLLCWDNEIGIQRGILQDVTMQSTTKQVYNQRENYKHHYTFSKLVIIQPYTHNITDIKL